MVTKLRYTIINILSLGFYKRYKKLANIARNLANIERNLSNIEPNLTIAKDTSIAIFNNLNFAQRFEYENAINKNKKSILFVTSLCQNGGIEERLLKIIQLIKHSYNIFIVTI